MSIGQIFFSLFRLMFIRIVFGVVILMKRLMTFLIFVAENVEISS